MECKKNMPGLTMDHEIKTQNGWKSLEDIDIDQDEIYVLHFYESEYCHRIYPDTSYLTPLSLNICLDYQGDFYTINNCGVDFQVTSDYPLPVNIPNTGCSYSGQAGHYDIESIINILSKAQQQPEDERDEVKLYSEFNNDILTDYEKNESWYQQIEIGLEDIQKNHLENVGIFNFTFPTTDSKTTYLINVRRNEFGECWV